MFRLGVASFKIEEYNSRYSIWDLAKLFQMHSPCMFLSTMILKNSVFPPKEWDNSTDTTGKSLLGCRYRVHSEKSHQDILTVGQKWC